MSGKDEGQSAFLPEFVAALHTIQNPSLLLEQCSKLSCIDIPRLKFCLEFGRVGHNDLSKKNDINYDITSQGQSTGGWSRCFGTIGPIGQQGLYLWVFEIWVKKRSSFGPAVRTSDRALGHYCELSGNS